MHRIGSPELHKSFCVFNKCQCAAARMLRGEPVVRTHRYVDHDREFVYYDIPKCASTTIRNMLFGNDPKKCLPIEADIPDNYKTFTFVREPLDRIISAYKMFTTKPIHVEQLKQFIPTPESLSFDEFVSFTTRVNNHHWQSQYKFIEHERVDYIGRVESVDDFNKLFTFLNIENIQLRHDNKADDHSKHGDKTTTRIIIERYETDYNMFGYEKN